MIEVILFGSALATVTLSLLVRNIMKSKKVSISLTEEEHKLVSMWATRSGLSLADYVKQTTVGSVPAPEQTKEEDTKQTQDALDRAFGHLDSMEGSLSPPGVFSFPPSRRPFTSDLTEATRTHPLQRVNRTGKTALPTVPPGPHPCIHLSPDVPSHMRGLCQGLCEHRSQRGRLCYYPPTSAMGCDLFESKVRPAGTAK